jgi:hypothetical protein
MSGDLYPNREHCAFSELSAKFSRTLPNLEINMKNKFEEFCYVCGEVVPEQAGLAEQRPREAGDAGFGKTKWVVRHTTCTPSSVGDGNKSNSNTNGN